ncbi:DUF4114 domain-containing protein [Jiulongibacter sp. NS-SX5]|uniref:DUF4114 domain-containing protein n=1 Tax=Jiulongibacter sp. NS-SX5 TaxID=3463854 RepID=UPI0040581A27
MKPLLILISVLSILAFDLNAQNYTYMGTYDTQGVPDYLEGRDVISSDFLTMVNASLPERYPVPFYNPQYITTSVSTNVEITETTDVSVTFITEGAGYKNTLGYYTYPTGNPPSSIDISNINIIFPNVSALYSGGGLVAGDKVNLGTFTPGTSIGWVLIANAWNGGSQSVGWGLWRLFSDVDYNPEPFEYQRFHNVLLFDEETDRIILGFEDIRRDNAGCDHDFNDAIFYVTTSVQESVDVSNINITTKVRTSVSSGNDGGLESDGSLAEKIAQRNVRRELLNKKKNFDNPMTMQSFTSSSTESELSFIPPELGPDSTESFVTTPEDLVDITNAIDVFSVDYFDESNRKAACLIAKTEGGAYQHNKAICDRVRGSTLVDSKLINIEGQYPCTLFSVEKPNGELEYALNFAFRKMNDTTYQFESHWRPEDYPEGHDYYNVQVWATEPSFAFYLAEASIDNLLELFTLNEETGFTSSPNILMRAGEYIQGSIQVDIQNVNRASKDVRLWGSYREFEGGPQLPFETTLTLDGSLFQSFTIDKSGVFDAGLFIEEDSLSDQDAVYLADGAWVANYEEENVANTALEIHYQSDLNETSPDKYYVERGITASGEVKNYYSAHRPLRLGLSPVDLSAYSYLQFTGTGISTLEIVLSKASVANWSEQARVFVTLTETTARHQISLADFKDNKGNPIDLSDINAITYSVISDNVNFIDFEFDLNQIAFSQTGSCDDSETVKSAANTDEIYQASAYLDVVNKNHQDSRVSMTAGNDIEFLPGFSTEEGAVLKAEINNCIN